MVGLQKCEKPERQPRTLRTESRCLGGAQASVRQSCVLSSEQGPLDWLASRPQATLLCICLSLQASACVERFELKSTKGAVRVEKMSHV